MNREKAPFQDVAKEHLPWLYSLARRIAGDEAEDVVQESLAKAYRKYDDLRDPVAAPAGSARSSSTVPGIGFGESRAGWRRHPPTTLANTRCIGPFPRRTLGPTPTPSTSTFSNHFPKMTYGRSSTVSNRSTGCLSSWFTWKDLPRARWRGCWGCPSTHFCPGCAEAERNSNKPCGSTPAPMTYSERRNRRDRLCRSRKAIVGIPRRRPQ